MFYLVFRELIGGKWEKAYLGHDCVAEDTLQHGDAAADNHVVADVLHYSSGLAGDEGKQHGRLVEIPKQEEFSAAGGGAGDVPEEVRLRIPEDPVETKDDLVQVAESKALDGSDLPVRQGRHKLDYVRRSIRVGGVRDGVLENTKRERAESDVALERHRRSFPAGVNRYHLNTSRSVVDLAHCGAQADVQPLRECDGNAGVPVPNCNKKKPTVEKEVPRHRTTSNCRGVTDTSGNHVCGTTGA